MQACLKRISPLVMTITISHHFVALRKFVHLLHDQLMSVGACVGWYCTQLHHQYKISANLTCAVQINMIINWYHYLWWYGSLSFINFLAIILFSIFKIIFWWHRCWILTFHFSLSTTYQILLHHHACRIL